MDRFGIIQKKYKRLLDIETTFQMKKSSFVLIFRYSFQSIMIINLNVSYNTMILSINNTKKYIKPTILIMTEIF